MDAYRAFLLKPDLTASERLLKCMNAYSDAGTARYEIMQWEVL